VGLVVSLLAVFAGLGIGAHIGWFYWRSHTVGAALVRREEAAIKAAAASTSKAACTTPPSEVAPSAASGSSTPALTPIGILEVPSIGLRAPVVQGVGNAQLDVAVGHVPTSVLPGRAGSAVLSAHDVSWFSQIDHLHRGDSILFAERCETLRYQVAGHQVVKTGSPIYSTPVPMLVMVTCYPLNALFLTPDRYVVTADLVAVSKTGKAGAPDVQTPPAPPLVVPAPPALADQGLTLATNDAPLGTLGFTGTPPAATLQSPVPMHIEASVLALYFAALRSAEQDHPGWWADVAPHVPFTDASPLVGGSITHNSASVTPTLAFTGATFTGATVTAEPEVAGGTAPGTYRLTMTAATRGNTLVVTGWQMTLLQ